MTNLQQKIGRGYENSNHTMCASRIQFEIPAKSTTQRALPISRFVQVTVDQNQSDNSENTPSLSIQHGSEFNLTVQLINNLIEKLRCNQGFTKLHSSFNQTNKKKRHSQLSAWFWSTMEIPSAPIKTEKRWIQSNFWRSNMNQKSICLCVTNTHPLTEKTR